MAKRGKDTVSKLIQTHLNGMAGRFLTERADMSGDMLYYDNFRQLSEMSRTRFEWFSTDPVNNPIPETVSIYHLEKELFATGCVVFFKDDVTSTGSFFALPGHGEGNQDMYSEYTRYRIDAPNFRQLSRDAKTECVPIWSNVSRMPDAPRVALYAERLTQLDQSFDVNARQVRRTRTVFADENQRVTYKNINDAIDRGDPVIFLQRGLDMKTAFDSVDLGMPAKELIDLDIARARIWARAMTNLGVDNANQDKKERVNAGEVEANNQQIGAMRQSPLDMRKEACAKINDMFGLALDVRYREMDIDSGIEDAEDTEAEDSDFEGDY